MLSLLLTAALAAANTPAPADWQDQLSWHGQQASIRRNDGGYLLQSPTGERQIPGGKLVADTASPLFNGLYAMAQDDLQQDSVSAINDASFDHNQAIPCACFETGVKWHYVWTRDLSYSVDLDLWRTDPERAKASLLFKLSDVREKSVPPGLYAMQDTGSGGSWPISTDRVVWFLAASHLLHDPAFADTVWQALNDTLAQDRQYAFDAGTGLYRGETSFLDWREQTYPAWTAQNVRFIAQSYALSTNVLHYQALRLAAELASTRKDPRAADYAAQAEALKLAINTLFWRADQGQYMSYIGGDGMPVNSYDLLGVSLAITSGVADPQRARLALAHYPTWPAGSPVIWPERSDQAIYHNRAIWPFVSAYALRAARAVDDPQRIAHELRSMMRGAALSGTNMENFELASQATHVDEGKLSGPVVDSERQLWSVAAYMNMVAEGVFGLQDDDSVQPKLPTSLVPMLFGQRDRITLHLVDRTISLIRPTTLSGNLLVADQISRHDRDVEVRLKSIQVADSPLRLDTPLYAPVAPAAPMLSASGTQWQVSTSGSSVLYLNGRRLRRFDGRTTVAMQPLQQCFSVTALDPHGLESLPSPTVCKGEVNSLDSSWPRTWKAPGSGRYQAALRYSNDNGPISSGVTAAVQWLEVSCGDTPVQRLPLVLPHSVGEQLSTSSTFSAQAGDSCRFALTPGFNMSDLSHFAHFTGGKGGVDGPLNEAHINALEISRLSSGSKQP